MTENSFSFSRRFNGWEEREPGTSTGRSSPPKPLADVTLSNPTLAELDYPEDLIEALARNTARPFPYRPEARGMHACREAIAAYYGERGISISPEDLFVCASTSEGYSHLFKLLCDPGEEVLFPSPSYPLIDHLAALENVRAVPYPLRMETTQDSGWSLDIDRLEACLSNRTRAILCVDPNNPTGSCLGASEYAGILSVAERHGLGLIVDEVFSDYLQPGKRHHLPQSDRVPVFSLNGFSKLLGLPQVKLGWIYVQAPKHLRPRIHQRLEIIADAYLSVSTAIQQASPALLPLRKGIQDRIRERIALNFERLRKELDSKLWLAPPIDGGWSLMIHSRQVIDADAAAERMLHEKGIVIHPGSLFSSRRESSFVLSLLSLPRHMDIAIEALNRIGADTGQA